MKPLQATTTAAAIFSFGTLGLLAGSCTGLVTNPAAPTEQRRPGALCASNGVSPGPAFIRRVTRLEYNNTVRDLLGDSRAVADSFPTEEVRLGFDNNAAALSVSPVLAEQYLLAAESIATNAVDTNLVNLTNIAPCDVAVEGVDECGQKFIAAFGAKAYRRPLDTADVALLTTVFNVGKTTDFKNGIRLVIAATLQSPQFLYRVEFGKAAAPGETVVRLDPWEMASRLSYLLWNTMPDDALFEAARADQLGTGEEIDAQVQRMLADDKARNTVANFQSQWLHLGEITHTEKDRAVFPAHTPAIAALMREEAQRFLEYVTWEGEGDLAAIFTAPFTFVNGPLATYYGLAGVSGSAFVKTPLDPATRAGFLTQGGILSLLGKADQTSPVYRGKFVREEFLCMTLPPPPPDLEIKPPELSTTLTTRQRFTQHAADPACSACHRLMDPIGLGLENFDGAGIFRATENGQPVDASGDIVQSDVAGPFTGALELQTKLASSAAVRDCVATKWFRYGYGRGETAADSCSLETVKARFAATGGKTRDLLVALTQTDAFRYRQVVTAVGGSP